VLDELVKQALVGTGRAAPALPHVEGLLGDALRAFDAEPPEAKLLAAGAVLSQYEACGRVPVSQTPPVAPAAPDARPACSPRAGDLLAMTLSMTNTPAKQALLGEWLALANAAKRRVPHRLLPALLEYGVSYRVLRESIANAADARGAWLMSLNPRWRFAAGAIEHADPQAIWETGTPEQRASAVRRLRESHSAGARQLIESTWKQDGADERARFVEAMRVSLSSEDEPFLEAALDDRSKQVRTAAAELLARLPGSAFVKRMIGRAEPLLQFTPGAAGALLRKGKPPKLDVTLPPEKFDTSWQRDGITEKPEERMGQRQWRLVQVLSNVPPAHWSAKWDAEPAAIVAAAVANEHADKLLLAWTRAAARHPDPLWVAALLRATPPGDTQRREGTELLAELPPAERLATAAEILEAWQAKFDALAHWLGQTDFPLDRRSAAAAIALVERHVNPSKGYDYYLPYVLDPLALRIPPELHDELAARWTGGGWEPNRTSLDKFFQTLCLRRDIQREFTNPP
jgi:hypothetical protein